MPEPDEAPHDRTFQDFAWILKLSPILSKMVDIGTELEDLNRRQLALVTELITIIEEEIKP